MFAAGRNDSASDISTRQEGIVDVNGADCGDGNCAIGPGLSRTSVWR
jgi:hypothetical protein